MWFDNKFLAKFTVYLYINFVGHYPWDIIVESKHPISKSIPVTPHSNSSSFFENNEMHEQTSLHEKIPHSILTDCELEERFETCSPPEKVTDVFSVINNRDMAWWAETDISIPNNKISPYKESTITPKHYITGEIGRFIKVYLTILQYFEQVYVACLLKILYEN